MDQPYFFFQGRRFDGLIGESGEFDHFFGHSNTLEIAGLPEKGPLHQLVTLDLSDPTLNLQIEGLRYLPLVYCFQFESGLLEYDLAGDGRIGVTKLDKESYDARWPYQDYPTQFPRIPFTIGDFRESTLEAFEKDVWQGIAAEEKNKFICIVPPSARYGVHLWQKDSDFDHISIKFFVDATNRKIAVYNECD